MSKKRSKAVASRSLRSVIDEQLAAAAREIWTLLQEPDAATERLKELVAERLAAAVNVIFTVFQKIRGEGATEEPGERANPTPGKSQQRNKRGFSEATVIE